MRLFEFQIDNIHLALDVSYRPTLTENGALVWEEVTADGHLTRYEEEPGVNPISRLLLLLLGLLPIEWLL